MGAALGSGTAATKAARVAKTTAKTNWKKEANLHKCTQGGGF